MLSSYADRCSECRGRMIDVGEEFVCSSCGMVTKKEILDSHEDKVPQAIDYTKNALGGYLGPQEYGYEEAFSSGFSKSGSTFKYLKTISDYAGKDSSTVYACARTIERVCEKISVPKIVAAQAMVIARKVFELKRSRNDLTVAAISSYSVITACKIEGITSIGVKEILYAHRALGHRVKMSAIIKISIDSPVRVGPRRAEDYLNRVVSHLLSNAELKERVRRRKLNETAYCHRLLLAAKQTLLSIEDSSRGGHSPCAMAAAALYAAEVALAKQEMRKKALTQRDVAEAIGVAEFTVREQYGEIFRPQLRQIEEGVRRMMFPHRTPSIETVQPIQVQNPEQRSPYN
jgi:transcription initiation factor TFIIIB Brf1 subunit/transcription initiation factor TFIIB